MSKSKSEDSDLDRYQIPRPHGQSTADIVRSLQKGDRIAHCEGYHEGNIRWTKREITAASDEWAEFGDYRLEVVEDEDIARSTIGDEGVQICSYRTGVKEPAGEIERIPREALAAETWYHWEVGVSETRTLEEVSTDQTMFVEAPSKELAVKTAKRRAEMDSGYEQVCYREGELEAGQ